MHEGGADTFAFRAMLSLGAMAGQDYTDRLSQALSSCMLGLQDASLHQSSEAGRTKNAYNCGNVIALLTEAVVRRRDPHQDIFSFWSELFRKSADRRYSEASYLAALRSYGGDDAASVIQAMLTSIGSSSKLVPALAALGVKTVADENATSRDYVQVAGKLACRAVIDQDCGEHSMVSEAGDRCTIDPESACTSLRPGSSLRAVGAHRIFREGPAAYDYVVNQCAAGASIAVTPDPEGPAIELPCSRPQPARPPYRRIVALPFELEPNGVAPPPSPPGG
jgi:predicted metalloprotease with PDZ domain